MNVLCMLISNLHRIAKHTLDSIEAELDFDAVVFSVAERAAPMLPVLKRWGGNRQTVFLPGCNSRLTMAHHRFQQLDEAAKILQLAGEKQGWIINADDDDLLLGPIPFHRAPEGKIGMFHTDIVAVCTVPSGESAAGDFRIRRSKTISLPAEGNFFMGSFWGVRCDAWLDVAPLVDRVTVFEEWNMCWHLLRRNWQDWHIPHALQLQRLRDYITAAKEQQSTGDTWENHVAQLERMHK